MIFNKVKHITAGIIIGAICTTSIGALASSSTLVNAWLTENVAFKFNDEYKTVPEEYKVFIYEDRTYVPVRFVAENLGATVDWDESSRTVKLSTPELKPSEEKEIEEENTEKENNLEESDIEESKENLQPERNYTKLPQTKTYKDMVVVATLVTQDDNYTRVYLSIENKGNIPLQLVLSEMEATVDGEKYTINNTPTHVWDIKWYHDINNDETRDGYVTLPTFNDEKKEMNLKLTILYNDGSQKKEELEFDIAY